MKNDRLEEIRRILGLNKTEFAHAMGISSHGYQHILAGKGKGGVTINHLESLFEKHSVNPAWVLLGQGEMFLTQDKTEWISGSIVPDVPTGFQVDETLLSQLMYKVSMASGLPLVSSDMAYALLLRYCKYYIHKNRDVAPDQWDIAAATAAFLAMTQTLQSMVSATFSLDGPDTVSVRFEGLVYKFQRPPRTGK